jgi:alcohol dehydrogenase class IV
VTYTFTLPRLERVIAGPGAVESLPAECERYGCRRALIVTGPTLAASPLLERLRRALGDRAVGLHAGVIQHVPARTVDALLQQVRDLHVDCLVSVGGGSPIDTVKAAVHALLAGSPGPMPADGPIHIAVPTTLSAAEFTDVAGQTDDTTRIKHALSDPRLAARTVLLDPIAALDTPAWLWAASGLRALDHAVETLYSARHHPVSDALAERAMTMLVEHLPASLRGTRDDQVRHRGECQIAAWMAVSGLTNAGSGISHMLGHQIGARWDVPHGVTSAIMLPHAMRFMAGVAPERFAPIARALRVPFSDPADAAHECAARVEAFVAQFMLPGRLRDVSVPAGELAGIAGHVCEVMNLDGPLGRPITQDEVVAILAAAH